MTNNLEMTVDFIMDGATNIKKSLDRFPITVHPDPVFIENNVHLVHDYITVWPCSHDRIDIKVFILE